MTFSLRIILLAWVTVLVGCASSSPAPVSGLSKYESTQRGSHRGSFYEVQKGDTLYFIAYVTDKDVKEIIQNNRLQEPYTIYPGQKLRLWGQSYQAPVYGKRPPEPEKKVTKTAATSTAQKQQPASQAKPQQQSNNSTQAQAKNQNGASSQVKQTPPQKQVDQSKSKEYVGTKSQQSVNKKVNDSKPTNGKVAKWLWPTKGRVVKNFAAGDQGNKGIDIAGQRGQAVVSTADGSVVYSGNALRGYGNLVIVKHNDDYLSAYAHNDKLLVNEGQSVKAGQQIATMGSSGAASVRLHFEIRYQGKSVNPKKYLP
ncbi:peptidoglycan DD-metalloendopeptidase family protein [Vibrio agarivorans]|uniref:peptidoglycan DD-metalloendopeptidase family protein n=1 Tax=Vibrio agarivorans TaxID=153622 RepID=UPI00222FD66E|nr:peptidoglycan DD-metalloendopeptidase family protein [Vibrio agarivorans]